MAGWHGSNALLRHSEGASRVAQCRGCARGFDCVQIAAHAADIARHRPGARDRDDELSRARYSFDWNKQFGVTRSRTRQGILRETLPVDIYKQAEFCHVDLSIVQCRQRPQKI